MARDLRHVWHPFTQHSAWPDDEPLVVERAEGMHLWDTDGNRYLDGVSSLWVTVHGHGVPEIDAAIRDQLDRLDHATFLGLTHEPGIELAERLLGDRAGRPDPGVLRRRRLVRRRGRDQDGLPGDGAAPAQQRPLYVHVAEGYHGDTLGAVSVGGIDAVPRDLPADPARHPHGVVPGRAGARARPARRAPPRCSPSCAPSLEREGDQVCAVVVEPLVQAAGGMLTHDAAFVRGVRALCDEFGALMVVDEVATGIGRTGRMWAVEHAGVTPDLMTCGKGLTGGYLPLSAVLAREEVYEAFLGAPSQARTFFHGHSYTANPLCCAAAIANLDLMAERGTVAHAARGGRADRRAAQRRRVVRRRARGPPHRHHDRHRGRRRSTSAPASPSARRRAGEGCGCDRSATSSC